MFRQEWQGLLEELVQSGELSCPVFVFPQLTILLILC